MKTSAQAAQESQGAISGSPDTLLLFISTSFLTTWSSAPAQNYLVAFKKKKPCPAMALV
jgi:hypothetical protein